MTAAKKEKSAEQKLKDLEKEYKSLVETNNALNQRVLELYTLYNVSKSLSMAMQLNELFDITMSLLGDSLNVNKYFLMLVDEESGKLVIRASHGIPEKVVMNGVVEAGDGVIGEVAKKNKPIMVQDIANEKDFKTLPGNPFKRGSYLGVPLINPATKHVMGVLSAVKTRKNGFGESDVGLFKAVAEHVAIALEKALTLQQTQELMSRDELTNLHNRRYFFERFEREFYRAERYERSLSLLMIDIDHFKNYNDTYGHLRGDHALKRLARVLEKALRKADVVARYGGEEFLILLPETEKKAAAIVGEKLRAMVEGVDFNADAADLDSASLTITVGIATYPEDSEEPLDLLDRADKALYFGKAQGRNQICTEVPQKA